MVYSNTNTYYLNKESYLDLQKVNEVEAKKQPKFSVTFFNNLIAKFKGADIKFCVSNSGNKKVLTLCPATNGDDNINKITNGGKNKLTIQLKKPLQNNNNWRRTVHLIPSQTCVSSITNKSANIY